jgi:deoxyribodipyrimidine photolyase
MNTSIQFPTNYSSITERIEQIDAKQYERTRNFINGAVTYLSPYIARGVIHLLPIKEIVVANMVVTFPKNWYKNWLGENFFKGYGNINKLKYLPT